MQASGGGLQAAGRGRRTAGRRTAGRRRPASKGMLRSGAVMRTP